MASEDNKTYSLNLSSQMILGLIVTFLPVIGGAAYSGIKFWGQMEKTIAAVDKFKPYDDTQFKERQQAFEIEIKTLKERQLALAEQSVRVAEKSSDAIALAPFTNRITYLEDGDWAVLTRTFAEIYDASNAKVSRPQIRSSASSFLVDKGNHRHFMAKEIHEQPEVVGHTLAHYVDFAAEQSLPKSGKGLGIITVEDHAKRTSDAIHAMSLGITDAKFSWCCNR